MCVFVSFLVLVWSAWGCCERRNGVRGMQLTRLCDAVCADAQPIACADAQPLHSIA